MLWKMDAIRFFGTKKNFSIQIPKQFILIWARRIEVAPRDTNF